MLEIVEKAFGNEWLDPKFPCRGHVEFLHDLGGNDRADVSCPYGPQERDGTGLLIGLAMIGGID